MNVSTQDGQGTMIIMQWCQQFSKVAGRPVFETVLPRSSEVCDTGADKTDFFDLCFGAFLLAGIF